MGILQEQVPPSDKLTDFGKHETPVEIKKVTAFKLQDHMSPYAYIQ
jgi:hypothetical protein